jgi:hypothetical protein
MTPDRRAEIAKRAYTLWELEGRPSGRDIEHWLRAEADCAAMEPAQAGEKPRPKPGRPATQRPRRK